MALDEALQRASAEKYRRRTLHNVLVVIFQGISFAHELAN